MSIWASGSPYEAYTGRWSRLVARVFLPWLAVPGGGRWLDIGCGTGALSETILEATDPAAVSGVDTSEGSIAHAHGHVRDACAAFVVADAQILPFEARRFDAVVSGLVLNFVPHPERALAEMVRVVQPDGTVGLYVWDYADEMQLMRRFWDAATALDPGVHDRDYPLCRPEPLERLFLSAGLEDVAVRSIDVPTVFRDFDDYWAPFLGAQGSAPSYAMSLSEPQRVALREHLRATLPTESDGAIRLIARAWAVRGRARRG
jgi:SAM-dependent methyltransferase